MSDPRVTDKVVGIAFAAFTFDKFAHPVQAMRSALEAAVPLLAPQPVDREAIAAVTQALRAEAHDIGLALPTTGDFLNKQADRLDAVLVSLARPVPTREQIGALLHDKLHTDPNRCGSHCMSETMPLADAVLALINGSGN